MVLLWWIWAKYHPTPNWPMPDLYGLRTTPQGYRIVKFDDLLNVLTTYELTQKRGYVSCQCFQASKETCRHRTMVRIFDHLNRADKGWFYEYDTGKWHKPIAMTIRRGK